MIEPLNDAVARGSGTQIQIRIAVGSRVLPPLRAQHARDFTLGGLLNEYI